MRPCSIGVILLIWLTCDQGKADTRRCNVNSDGCTCPQGTFLFDGDCHSPSNFEEECYFVHQCLRGSDTYGDPFIACINGSCICRPGTQMYEGRCRNFTLPVRIVTTTSSPIVVEIKSEAKNDTLVLSTTPHYMENVTAHSDDKSKPSSLSSIAIGSIAFVLLSALMMAACFCFWSLGRFILISIYSSPTISIPEDHSVPTHHKFYDDVFDDIEVGRDNPCFLVDKTKAIEARQESLTDPELVKLSFEKDRHSSAPDGDESSQFDDEEIYDKAFKTKESLKYIDDTTDDAGTARHSRCQSSSSEGEII